jgi:chromosome condensin MukBEF ATPase and DNA-binding subunit MukB
MHILSSQQYISISLFLVLLCIQLFYQSLILFLGTHLSVFFIKNEESITNSNQKQRHTAAKHLANTSTDETRGHEQCPSQTNTNNPLTEMSGAQPSNEAK